MWDLKAVLKTLILQAGLGLLLQTSSAWAESGAKVSGVVFGASKLARNSLALTEFEQDEISVARLEVIQEILFSGENFWKILSKGSPESIDAEFRERAVKQFSESIVLVWAEPGDTPCPADSPSACAISKVINDIQAISYTLDPCLLKTRYSSDCKVVLKLQEGILKADPGLKNALRRALAHGAVKFSDAYPTSTGRRQARERIERLLVDTRTLILETQDACPGPFQKVTQLALLESKLMRPLENSYVKVCATRYTGVLHAKGVGWTQIPESCRLILDPKRWEAWKTIRDAQAVRCGSACQELLCGPRMVARSTDYFEGADVDRNPRLLWFGSDPVLEVPESACSGPDPIRMGEYLRQSLLPYLVRPQFAARAIAGQNRFEYRAAWDACVKALSPAPDHKSAPSSSSGDGMAPGDEVFIE
jgi:hypothetical protein